MHDLLETWIRARVQPEVLAWLREKKADIAAGAADRHVFAAFSAAVRHAGKAALALGPADLKAAGDAVEGWTPRDWSLDEAARIFLLLAIPASESPRLCQLMYETADVGEAAALIKALPLLPDPKAHMPRAREAIRSNIKQVFEAVALRNPYPALHFDDTGWNQLVVKTFFVDAPLGEVWGLDRRVNAPLRQMLVDLAHERWAAGRTFSPLLWRCVGPLADDKALAALKRALDQGGPAERRAAALSLAACKLPEAARLLAADAALAEAVKDGKITWENYDAL